MMGQSGMAAEIKPSTVSSVFLKACDEKGDAPSMHVMRDGKHLTWSWTQFKKEAYAFSKSLTHLAVDERSVINIMGFNSPEWAISYYGGILHNNVVSGVYTTNGAEACKYQAHHSQAQVICVETIEHLKLYLEVLDGLPDVKAIVVWGVKTIPMDLAKDQRIHTWDQFLQLGKSIADEVVEPFIQR